MIFVGAEDDAGADFDGGENGGDAEDGGDEQAERKAEEEGFRVDFPDEGLAEGD